MIISSWWSVSSGWVCATGGGIEPYATFWSRFLIDNLYRVDGVYVTSP